ncbi:MAG: hypothetical protein IJH65_03305 [Methanobrevibacter sp.]|nr:hypothetical protein [Methanobrevibacter sp.]
MADVEKKAMSSTPKVSVDVGGQFDYIRNLRERKKLQAEIEKLQQKSQTKLNSEEKKQQEELLKEKEDRLKQINEDIEDEKDKRDEKRNEVSKKVLENAGNAAASAVTDGLLKLKSTLESTMDSFLKTQESIAYNLNGTSLSVEKVSDDLTRAIAGSGIVRQEAVYSKLDEMVRQGIVYNVEQRAFLQTLSDDLGMMFNATDGTFLRLINLQRKDLTDQRMAIQASLKTFLNQNYETSQYIANGFQSVSNALIEAQSTMTSSAGMALEATIQK